VFSQDGRRVGWVSVAFGVGDTHTVHVTGADGGWPRPLPGRFAAAPVFSPDGRRVATVSANTTVRVWDADTATELFSVFTHSPGRPTGRRTLADLLRPAGDAPHLAFSPDLTRLAGVAPDGRLRIWDASFRPPPVPILVPDATPARVVNTPGGWRVLLGRRPVTVWNPDTGGAVTIDPRLRAGNELAVSPARGLLAANGSDELRVWSLETGQLLRTLGVGTRPVGMAFSPDGRHIGAIDAVDNALRVWDVDTGAETFFIPVPQNRGVAVRFSTDGRRVKFIPVPVRQGGADTPPATQKREWELATKQPRDPTDDDPADTERVVFTPAAGTVELPLDASSPDGKRRVVVGTDSGVRLVGEGISQELLTLTERRGDVSAVAFSADGRRVLVVGPGGAEIFDASPRTPVVRWLDTAPPPRAKP
jgi:WD40 repeat protein